MASHPAGRRVAMRTAQGLRFLHSCAPGSSRAREKPPMRVWNPREVRARKWRNDGATPKPIARAIRRQAQPPPGIAIPGVASILFT